MSRRKPRPLTHKIGAPDRKAAAQAAEARRREYLAQHGDKVDQDYAMAKSGRELAKVHSVHEAAERAAERRAMRSGAHFADVLNAELPDSIAVVAA